MTRKTIREFCDSRSGDQDQAERTFRTWRKVVEKAAWKNFNELKGDFPSADMVGDCLVFDVGHNKYRVIAKIDYELQRLFLRAILIHAEYDQEKWKEECGCDKKHRRKAAPKKAAPKESPHRAAPKSGRKP